MADPYAILGVSADADETTIRRRYLALVKQYPPEHQPQKFAEVREAYEHLKDPTTGLYRRLFEPEKMETLDALIEEVSCRSSRRRVSLTTLLNVMHKP